MTLRAAVMHTTTGPTLGALADKLLDQTAGLSVNADVFHAHRLNLAKLKALAQAYKNGWLHNLMTRITPITVRNPADYVLMATLFTPTRAAAEALLDVLSADLTTFATTAGLPPQAPELAPHRQLYGQLAQALGTRFRFTPPAAFASTTITAADVARANLVRQLMHKTYPGRERTLVFELND